MGERPTILAAEELARYRTNGVENAESISLMSDRRVNYLKVSLPRFVATLESDRHVSLILSLLGSTSSSSSSQQQQQQDGNQLASRVQKLVLDHARQLLRLAQEYHNNESRQVQLKASKISAALLDGAIVDALEFLKIQQQQQQNATSTASSLVFGDAASGVLADRFIPFANRALNEYGFPTEAKYQDYARWVALEDDSYYAMQQQRRN